MACMSVPWLLSMGHTIVYSALFTKLWRVNKVLSFSRRRVQIKHVVAPMVTLFLAAVAVLVLWTVLDPLKWERYELDEETNESIGRCQSSNIGVYIGPLLGIMLIPTVLTGYMAYRTKDVDEAYTESWWDFILISVQLEVIVVSAPVIAILRNESSNGKYLGFVFLLWSFPMSTLTLIFLPKVLAYRRAKRGLSLEPQPKRGKHEGTRVSGITTDKGKQSRVQYSSGADQSSTTEVIESHSMNVRASQFEDEFGEVSPSYELAVVPEDAEARVVVEDGKEPCPESSQGTNGGSTWEEQPTTPITHDIPSQSPVSNENVINEDERYGKKFAEEPDEGVGEENNEQPPSPEESDAK